MDKSVVKALVMAQISPIGIGALIPEISFNNLSKNAQRIVDHCMPTNIPEVKEVKEVKG